MLHLRAPRTPDQRPRGHPRAEPLHHTPLRPNTPRPGALGARPKTTLPPIARRRATRHKRNRNATRRDAPGPSDPRRDTHPNRTHRQHGHHQRHLRALPPPPTRTRTQPIRSRPRPWRRRTHPLARHRDRQGTPGKPLPNRTKSAHLNTHTRARGTQHHQNQETPRRTTQRNTHHRYRHLRRRASLGSQIDCHSHTPTRTQPTTGDQHPHPPQPIHHPNTPRHLHHSTHTRRTTHIRPMP